ncbi:PREDICTED: putative olfactory receptor 52P1 [Nanorana parkeri]|uniref:putative olfactory receptor 52P1 n=1 Tax=Nanorana parkeri TaxID=125878 RepID=UPI0008545961|nr:PREDICTED: putative olfactory receptor 52P1 [Nanorana parkeri]
MNVASSGENETFYQPENFILLGIPGLEVSHFWISIPMAGMYVLTILGNSVILAIIMPQETFHKPMYLFLSMMAIIDLVASATTTPKILCIFWFNSKEIGFSACLAQLFFIHALSMMESTILLAMAFDRYVAICHPLRYTSILTNTIIAKIGVMAIIRGSFFMAPAPFLIRRLSYCQTNVISHTYCEHMAVVKIACTNTTINQAYGLTVALLVIAVDIACISVSYCGIFRAVFRLSSREARRKALGTCGPHICVILISYIPALFSFFTHRFGHNIPLHIHITLANLYILIPPMCNPLIYGARTKEIRRRVVAIFRQ